MKQGGVTSERIRIKIWHILFHPLLLVNFLGKKLVPTLFSFAATDHRGFSSLAAFSGTIPTFKKKNESDILKQNLVLNQLAPTSNPKMKNQKARAPFPNCFFISRPFNLKFFLFSGKFWTVEKFLPSRSEAKKKVAGLDKKCLFGL